MSSPKAFLLIVLRAACLWAVLISPAVAIVFDTVALTGERAPGTPDDVVFSQFDRAPAINNAGEVAFIANITGPGVTGNNSSGVWSGLPANPGLVVRRGDPTPGIPGGEFDFFELDNPVLGDDGTVAFLVNTQVPSVSSDDSIWAGKPNNPASLRLVARENDPAPGTTGLIYGSANINFNTFSFPRVNEQGRVAFQSFVSDPVNSINQNTNGIWAETAGGAQLVALEGGPAPSPPGGNFQLNITTPHFNSAGEVLFFGAIGGINDGALWLGPPGGVQFVIEEGDPAPGIPGVSLSGTSGVSVPNGLNDGGNIAFKSRLTGGSSQNEAIFFGPGANVAAIAPVVRKGDAAPVPGETGLAFDFLAAPLLSGNNDLAFTSGLSGTGVDSTNDSAVWIAKSAGAGAFDLTMIAREGDRAPGTGTGVVFASSSAFGQLALNKLGQVAFVGRLTGTGVDGDSDAGLWATDLAGELQLIAREGDPFEVSPGEFRTVEKIGFAITPAISIASGSGGEDGGSRALNDLGELAFRLQFSDQSWGIFTAQFETIIPEPGAGGLFWTAAVLCGAWRRRRRLSGTRSPLARG